MKVGSGNGVVSELVEGEGTLVTFGCHERPFFTALRKLL